MKIEVHSGTMNETELVVKSGDELVVIDDGSLDVMAKGDITVEENATIRFEADKHGPITLYSSEGNIVIRGKITGADGKRGKDASNKGIGNCAAHAADGGAAGYIQLLSSKGYVYIAATGSIKGGEGARAVMRMRPEAAPHSSPNPERADWEGRFTSMPITF